MGNRGGYRRARIVFPVRWGQASLLSLALGIGAIGCSSSGQSGAPNGTVPHADFASTFAPSYCNSIQNCCSRSGYDSSTCQSSLQAQLNAALVTAAANPKIAYDSAAAARLVNAVVALNTGCTDHTLLHAANVAWDQIFKGTVESGGSCGSSQDCISPDAGYATCNAGICTLGSSTGAFDGPRATLGQSCGSTCSGDANSSTCNGNGTSASCWINDGIYCNGNTCAAVPSIGQPCGGGSYCEIAGHCESGRCVADTATGACSSNDACVSTSYCDFTARACTPKKANGATCNQGGECTGGQCEQDVCRNWTIATPALCAGLLD